jgi:hypothetical protein
MLRVGVAVRADVSDADGSKLRQRDLHHADLSFTAPWTKSGTISERFSGGKRGDKTRFRHADARRKERGGDRDHPLEHEPQ